jgi:hypothetical protein
MAEPDKGKPVSLEELMVTTLAMADAVTKLLIEKGIITEAEFKQKAAAGGCGVPADFASDNAVADALLYLAVREYRRSAMRQMVFYYLLALNLVGGFWLVYAITVTQRQNRRERPEQERVLAAQSEIKHLTPSRLIEQQQLSTCNANDPNDVPEMLDEDILCQIEQLQNEINKRVVELEREL